jgi:hypothetical protein
MDDLLGNGRKNKNQLLLIGILESEIQAKNYTVLNESTLTVWIEKYMYDEPIDGVNYLIGWLSLITPTVDVSALHEDLSINDRMKCGVLPTTSNTEIRIGETKRLTYLLT